MSSLLKLVSLSRLVLITSFFAASNLAYAAADIYGRANVSFNKHDAEDNSGTLEDRWKLNSNTSMFGIKGAEELEGGLSAIYKMEFEVAMDDGKASTSTITADCDGTDTVDDCGSVSDLFKQRNIFVGLKGDFGQIIAGRHDTPLKLSQGKIDRFNNLTLGDLKNVFEGENRMSNILMYSSPTLNGFSGNLAVIPGEGTAATDNNGPADALSASVTYSADRFWLSLASDSEVNGRDDIRATVEYLFANTKVAVMLQSGEDIATGDESDIYLLNAQHSIDKWVLKGQYASRTDKLATDVDTSMFTVGSDYKLSKNVTLYAYASQWDTDAADEEQSTIGLGTEVKF